MAASADEAPLKPESLLSLLEAKVTCGKRHFGFQKGSTHLLKNRPPLIREVIVVASIGKGTVAQYYLRGTEYYLHGKEPAGIWLADAWH
jgi:hypothetical protein